MSEIPANIKEAIVKIRVIGVGGGGGNVLRRMAEDQFLNNELYAVNTDIKQLENLSKYGVNVIDVGTNLTKGRGTGGRVELGERAANEDEDKIRNIMKGQDLIFITATMGGGMGTGAAPVIAKIAKEMGVLTIGVVTEPFGFEGRRKIMTARAGIAKMQESMDALIIVKNDNFMKLPEFKTLKFNDVFSMADEILRKSISSVAEMIQTTGLINVDFADVTTIFRQSDNSDAILGMGEGDDAITAVKKAIHSPLVDRGLLGARGIIINITGAPELPLVSVNEATQYIYENTDDEVNTILGIVINPDMGYRVRATVIATDFIDNGVPNMDVPTGRLGNRTASRSVANRTASPAFGNRRPQAQRAAAKPAEKPAAPEPEAQPQANPVQDVPSFMRSNQTNVNPDGYSPSSSGSSPVDRLNFFRRNK